MTGLEEGDPEERGGIGARVPGDGGVRHPTRYRRDVARPRRYRIVPPTISAALTAEVAGMASLPMGAGEGGEPCWPSPDGVSSP